MTKISLAGLASTQSRGRRPLPPGAVSARTLRATGVWEDVEFVYADGHTEVKELLTWVVGQAGLLFGAPDERTLLTFNGTYPLTEAIESAGSNIPGSYGHGHEYALADALSTVFDGLLTSDDLAVRFFQNGGDSCAAAVRVARAVTGREPIASQGYHGAQTDFSHEPGNLGYPGYAERGHYRFECYDPRTEPEWKAHSRLFYCAEKCACLMVEVPPVEDEAARLWLSVCRAACDHNNIPLIFDDVVLGFRLALGGTAEYYGVKPDMICLGKAMCATGGVSALIGRADMVGRLGTDVFYSTTFGGAPGPCAVAAATVRWLLANRDTVYGEAGHLRRIGQALKDGYNALGIKCIGQPERSVFAFPSDDEWLAFCSRMIGAGYMVHRPNFPTLVHTLSDVEETLAAARKVSTNVV